jgi:hypothetical protein
MKQQIFCAAMFMQSAFGVDALELEKKIDYGLAACIDNGNTLEQFEKHLSTFNPTKVPENEKTATARDNNYNQWTFSIGGLKYKAELTPWFFCRWQLPTIDNIQEQAKSYVNNLLIDVRSKVVETAFKSYHYHGLYHGEAVEISVEPQLFDDHLILIIIIDRLRKEVYSPWWKPNWSGELINPTDAKGN